MSTPPDGQRLGGLLDAGYADERQTSKVLRYRYKARALMAYEMAKELLPSQDRYAVLDLGAADGRTLLELRRLLGGGGRFDGIEAAPDLVERAPELPEDTRLFVGDVLAPPEQCEDESYDLVCALALLEHLETPHELGRVAARLLRPGGVFVATCPHPLWDDVAGRLGLLEDDAHLVEMDREKMREVAEQVGPAKVLPFMSVGIGSLPYLGIAVSPRVSARIDGILRRLPFTRHLFVNQAVAAQKPTEA